MPDSPKLFLQDDHSPEGLAALYVALTGREPTEDEMEELHNAVAEDAASNGQPR